MACRERPKSCVTSVWLRSSIPNASRVDLAKKYEVLVRQVAPLLGPMIQDMLRLQLRHRWKPRRSAQPNVAEGQRLPGARLVTHRLRRPRRVHQPRRSGGAGRAGGLAHRLTDLAHEVVVPPVRFIKTIGDEVMLVSPIRCCCCDAVIRLVDATEGDDDFPRIRVGYGDRHRRSAGRGTGSAVR